MEPKNAYVRLLEIARAYIASGRQKFVCAALEDAYDCVRYDDPRLECRRACDALRTWIRNDLLDRHYTLEGWLTAHHGVQHADFRTDEGKARLRATRLAWIGWMLTEVRSW